MTDSKQSYNSNLVQLQTGIFERIIKYFDFGFNFASEVCKIDLTDDKDLTSLKSKIRMKNFLRQANGPNINDWIFNMHNKELIKQYLVYKRLSIQKVQNHPPISQKHTLYFSYEVTYIIQISASKIALGDISGGVGIIDLHETSNNKHFNEQVCRIINMIYIDEMGLVLAASSDGIIKIYNDAITRSLYTIEYLGVCCSMEICLVNNQKYLIIGSQNGYLELFNMTWNLAHELKVSDYFITSLKFINCANSFSYLSVGNFEGNLHLVELKGLEVVMTYYKIHSGLINYLAKIKTKYIVSFSYEDSLCCLWNMNIKNPLKIFNLARFETIIELKIVDESFMLFVNEKCGIGLIDLELTNLKSVESKNEILQNCGLTKKIGEEGIEVLNNRNTYYYNQESTDNQIQYGLIRLLYKKSCPQSKIERFCPSSLVLVEKQNSNMIYFSN